MASRRLLELRVSGMTCGACSAAVEHSLKSLAGVRTVSVSLLTHSALVETDGSAAVKDEAVVEAVEDAGFEASLKGARDVVPSNVALPATSATLRLQLFGLRTEADAEAAVQVLLRCAGVAEAALEAPTSSLSLPVASVCFDPRLSGPRHLMRALRGAGVEARLAPAASGESSEGTACTQLC